MTYERFEQLPVWQAGMKLTENIFKLTEDKAFNFKGDLRSQLQRAALFGAEQCGRGFRARHDAGVADVSVHCARLRRGSPLDALPAGTPVVLRTFEISNLRFEIAGRVNFTSASGVGGTLRNSPIAGQRYLTGKQQRINEGKQRAAAFLNKLQQVRARPKP
jgi:hypothetical protein